MRWISPLTPDITHTAETIGGKAHGLVVLQRLDLPVPPGFVISTEACRFFLRAGRFPDGLETELATALAGLETATGLRFGDSLLVSVRSGAAISMPGMMDTVLNLGADLEQAIAAVFSSWDTPRARIYREINEIPHDLGTAVTVQAMVFGDRDDHSGTGVAFSRDPNTGEPVPYGEVLFGHQGEDVVAGTSVTRPLAELAGREPAVWAGLLEALKRIEKHYRDACYVEFTYETGEFWILQVRAGRFVGRAAVRVATDLVDEGMIERHEAVSRVSAQDLRQARVPRMAARDVLGRGLGACPGVAAGRVATTSDNAVRMAAEGPVILVRPQTSPLDMHGLAAAAGVVTALGGPASHAAVVARAMGKPAVVGVSDLTVPEGTVITIDGTAGEIALGNVPVVTAEDDPHLRRLLSWADS